MPEILKCLKPWKKHKKLANLRGVQPFVCAWTRASKAKELCHESHVIGYETKKDQSKKLSGEPPVPLFKVYLEKEGGGFVSVTHLMETTLAEVLDTVCKKRALNPGIVYMISGLSCCHQRNTCFSSVMTLHQQTKSYQWTKLSESWVSTNCS
jgi:hypothetical protein